MKPQKKLMVSKLKTTTYQTNRNFQLTIINTRYMKRQTRSITSLCPKVTVVVNEEELKKTVREEEELKRQEEVSRAAAAAEARRQEAEREERERRRQESELAAMRERHLRERVAHISQTAHGQKMLSNINEEFNFVTEHRINEEELKKTVREEEELRRQEEVSRAAAAAEARRQEAKREERERRRQESELAAMSERHLRERVAHISQTAHGQKMLFNLATPID
ncbi:hypothetical protein PYW07_004085 [Mythimna separata]|uniref:Uncharacterized protein n=1 Tax=Mythimna separata TaxID=271217 RepID=A0AAD7YQU5_MYTSE|nr:hypothetical protein PYW07_004085 [Mythimna separata]